MPEAEEVYIDPQIAQILKEAAEAGLAPMCELTVAEARAQMNRTMAVWNEPLPPMADVMHRVIPGPAGGIAARLLRPRPEPDLPVIVYFHGGGWVLGSLDTHHRLMRMLARASGAAVLGVDYRLAPEAPFPAPLDDCLAAIRWLRGTGKELGLDPERMAVAGDSAGANLALASLLALRDAGEPLPRGAALFYGCYASRLDAPSYRAFGDGNYRLSTAEMAWFWSHFLGDTRPGHPLAEPLHADLEGLPPLYVLGAALDPLADDSRALCRRLADAGVAHQFDEWPGVVHGFLQMTARCDAATQAMTRAGNVIRDMLATSPA